ncbi:hypothetical protein GCM10009789_71510 [Kribbella sancticallisti]|uniref:Aminoglycoside phosphotransferase domain-containing protein n=1 Tax=Kribbella sancticallisti TaxID=460087 RepID=A0ABP4QCA3_9ACTN
MEDRLRRWIRDDFGLDVIELTRIDHGADAAATVWQARTATEPRQYAVKWSGGGTGAALQTTAYLAANNIPGVPSPVTTTTGELWSEHEGKRLSLTPWIPGTRAAASGLTTDQWTSYGALLGRVHALEPPPALVAALPPLNPINARMPSLARSIEHRLRTEPPADSLEADLARIWEANQKTITALLDLAADLEPPNGPRVICHADPHLGNVLVDPSTIHLIDWDDAVLAPREQDLLFMLGGMGSLGPTTHEQRRAFFQGYGEVTIDRTRLTYYRCARALEDVALWSEQALQGPDREDCLEILRDALGPDGLAVRTLS